MGDNFEKLTGGLFLPVLSTTPSGIQGYVFQDTSNSIVLQGMDVKITQGQKLRINEAGGAPSTGIATLSAGTVTVSTTAVTANSRIFLTVQVPSLNLGFIYVSSRTSGTSFTITSLNVLDTSQVGFLIIN